MAEEISLDPLEMQLRTLTARLTAMERDRHDQQRQERNVSQRTMELLERQISSLVQQMTKAFEPTREPRAPARTALGRFVQWNWGGENNQPRGLGQAPPMREPPALMPHAEVQEITSAVQNLDKTMDRGLKRLDATIDRAFRRMGRPLDRQPRPLLPSRTQLAAAGLRPPPSEGGLLGGLGDVAGSLLGGAISGGAGRMLGGAGRGAGRLLGGAGRMLPAVGRMAMRPGPLGLAMGAADALGVGPEALITSATGSGAVGGILGNAATGAATGAMLGPWGALAGGLAGAGYGAYEHWDEVSEAMADTNKWMRRQVRASLGMEKDIGSIEEKSSIWDDILDGIKNLLPSWLRPGGPDTGPKQGAGSAGVGGGPGGAAGAPLTGDAANRAATMMRDFEGFSEKAYWDKNAWRVGYGSDTITDPTTGEVRPVKQGDTVNRQQAEADLQRRITTEFGPRAAGQVGKETWDKLPENTKAALISNAYNYGSLRPEVVDAAKTGDPQKIAQAIRMQSSHDMGINQGRRAREATIATTPDAAPQGAPTGQLNPDLQARLDAMGKEYQEKTGQPLQITSSVRSREEQEKLYANRGSNPYPVAAPGTSKHERGLAVDVPPAVADYLDKSGLLAKYGLGRPVANDPVHIEAVGQPQVAIGTPTTPVPAAAPGPVATPGTPPSAPTTAAAATPATPTAAPTQMQPAVPPTPDGATAPTLQPAAAATPDQQAAAAPYVGMPPAIGRGHPLPDINTIPLMPFDTGLLALQLAIV